MDHAGIREMLSAYLDGEVTPGERSLIEEHLKTCPECGNALR
ncbi:MAG: zf-HC2 domain-containing protein [Geobacteraceae bacterium]|nr:zf-HC2 domain-containing protein [Geobacteraceae bacterium]